MLRECFELLCLPTLSYCHRQRPNDMHIQGIVNRLHVK